MEAIDITREDVGPKNNEHNVWEGDLEPYEFVPATRRNGAMIDLLYDLLY